MFGTIWWDKQRKTPFPPLRENFVATTSTNANNVASLYGYRPEGYNTAPSRGVATCTNREGVMGSRRWCEGPYFSTSGDYVAKTLTTALVGEPNPRTRFAPIIAPPITDIDAWGTDNYTVHSSTNQSSPEELSFFEGPPRQNFTRHQSHASDCYTLETVPQILQNAAISSLPSHSSEHDLGRRLWTGDELGVHNVLDPRSSAFASPLSGCERSYVDQRLGQAKFYYDDINLGKGSNYISRNKIDVYSFAEQTGRLAHPDEKCSDNRDQVLDAFHASAVDRRVNLQQSWMNKRNRERWQQKMFPITTNGQRMLGSAVKI